MKNIKEFCMEHKGKIVFGCCMVGSAVIGALLCKANTKEAVDPYAGKSVLSWKENGGFITLETAKEVLDLNANSTESFAIIKESSGSDVYNCVLISGNVITDKPEEA